MKRSCPDVTRATTAAACLVALAGCTAPQPDSNHAPTGAQGSSAVTRVTGIGGVFFKTEDPVRTRDWYRTHLGIEADEWGGFAFQWNEKGKPEEIGYTVWGPFPRTTDYFGSGDQPFMVNYRVADLTALIAALRAEGVEILGEIEQHPNGKFAWIRDPDGRKVELWEPVPSAADPYLK